MTLNMKLPLVRFSRFLSLICFVFASDIGILGLDLLSLHGLSVKLILVLTVIALSPYAILMVMNWIVFGRNTVWINRGFAA